MSHSTPINREIITDSMSETIGELQVTEEEVIDELNTIQTVQSDRLDVWVSRCMKPSETVALGCVNDGVYYFLVDSYSVQSPTSYFEDEVIGHLDIGQENYGEYMYSHISRIMRNAFADVCSFPWHHQTLVVDGSDTDVSLLVDE